MNLDDFDYKLPDNLIALKPVENRENCRMLVLNKSTGEINHKMFTDIVSYFNSGDVLILNNTKVIHARLNAKRKSGGNVEIFLLESEDNKEWKVLTNRTRRLKIGEELSINDSLNAKILTKEGDGVKRIVFNKTLTNGLLKEVGEIPLPPYIKKRRNPDYRDETWYQTVFAEHPGSMASPTAGLHFTENVLNLLKKKGIIIQYITLHISLSTFNPIRTKNINEHKMHSEFFSIGDETVETIKQAKKSGNKIVAVGTTAVRTLETVFKNKEVKINSGYTDLYIKPGYKFKICDAIITNFHAPKTSLIVLVSTFASIKLIKEAYKIAIDNQYKFLSYGDCMFIHKGEANG